MDRRIPSTGIVVVAGTPGSGKSYFAVMEMASVVLRERRPVFTNIPIVLGALRAYVVIKGGDRRLAGLIRSLSKDHFDRFCARLQRIDHVAENLSATKTCDKDLAKLSKFSQQDARAEAVAIVNKELGEPRVVTTSEGPADWIPPRAVLFLDELHKWYPSRNSREEPSQILAYTSMHRHIMHRCYVLTQRAMNVSLSFRAMAVEFIFCHEYSRMPVVWIVRVPFKVFKYSFFDSSQIADGEPRHMAKPTFSFLELPFATSHVIYRLYRSYSHAGSVKALHAEADDVVNRMTGTTEKPEVKTVGPKISLYRRIKGWSVTVSCIILAFWLGGFRHPPQVPVVPEPVAAKLTPVETALIVQKTTPILQGTMLGTAIVDGQRIQTGGTYDGATLIGVDDTGGRTVWLAPPRRVIVWNIGNEQHVGVLSDRGGVSGLSEVDLATVAEAVRSGGPRK
jgi:hypothetical protein